MKPDLLAELRRYGELQASEKYTYVVRHPLADEADILERLAMKPSQCVDVDLYWVYKGNWFWVGVWCWDKNDIRTWIARNIWSNKNAIHVKTRECPLTTHTIEAVLDYLADWLTTNRHIWRGRRPAYIPISQGDILGGITR